jgi:hypothetical protein
MKQLKNVTLVTVSTQNVKAAISALEYSQLGIKFNEILLVSHENPLGNDAFYRFVPIIPFTSIGEWGKYVVFNLYKHIKTDFILFIHEDGFVVNPKSWNDDWLQYDYIGAPFPLPRDDYSYRDVSGNIIRVGNSVSLRSKKLLELPDKLGLEWKNFDKDYPHEDGFLTVQHRHTLIQNGINYAPLDIAVRFGRETNLPEHSGINPFTFHKWAGPNRNYPCFNHKEVLKKKWRKLKTKLKELFKL